MARVRRHRLRERVASRPEHGVSPVKLIDMRFIIALGELGGTMVRRQDLPKEAFIDLDTLKGLKAPSTPCPSSRSRTVAAAGPP